MRQGALWAMRYMHDSKAVEGLIRKLGTTRAAELRRDILATLVRLYHREADYKGVWWGIRPRTPAPTSMPSSGTRASGSGRSSTSAVLDSDPDTAAFLTSGAGPTRVSTSRGCPSVTTPVRAAEKEATVVVPKADPKNPNQIGNMTYEAAAKRTLAARGDATEGRRFSRPSPATPATPTRTVRR